MLKRKIICTVVMCSYSGLLLGCNGGTGNNNTNNTISTPEVIKLTNFIKDAAPSSIQVTEDKVSTITQNLPAFTGLAVGGSFKLVRDSDRYYTYIFYSDSSNRGKLSIADLDNGAYNVLLTGQSNNPISEIKVVLGEVVGQEQSSDKNNPTSYDVHALYVMYRDLGTNKFHVKRFVPAYNGNSAQITEFGTQNSQNNYSFEGRSATGVANIADLSVGENGKVYVGFINQFDKPVIAAYNAASDSFRAVNEKSYGRAINIPNAKEISMAISPADDLPVAFIASDSTDSHAALIRFQPKSASQYDDIVKNDSGIDYTTAGNWTYYYGTTEKNLSGNKINNISLMIDSNAYPVMAFNSVSGTQEQLHIKRLHYSYDPTKESGKMTTYDLQDLSTGLSTGKAVNVNLHEDRVLNEYYVTYSDLGNVGVDSPNYTPGIVKLSRYNDNQDGSGRWVTTREYIAPSGTHTVSVNGELNDVYVDERTGLTVLAYQNPNNSNGLEISTGERHDTEESKKAEFESGDESESGNAVESGIPTKPTRKLFYTANSYSGNLVQEAANQGLGNFSGANAGYTAADALCNNDANNPNGKGHGTVHALLYGNPAIDANFATEARYENTKEDLVDNNFLDESDIPWLNNGHGLSHHIDGSGNLSEFWTGYYNYGGNIQGPKSYADTNNHTRGALTVAYPSSYYQYFNCSNWTSDTSVASYGNDNSYEIGVDAADAKLNGLTAFWIEKSPADKVWVKTTAQAPGNYSKEYQIALAHTSFDSIIAQAGVNAGVAAATIITVSAKLLLQKYFQNKIAIEETRISGLDMGIKEMIKSIEIKEANYEKNLNGSLTEFNAMREDLRGTLNNIRKNLKDYQDSFNGKNLSNRLLGDEELLSIHSDMDQDLRVAIRDADIDDAVRGYSNPDLDFVKGRFGVLKAEMKTLLERINDLRRSYLRARSSGKSISDLYRNRLERMENTSGRLNRNFFAELDRAFSEISSKELAINIVRASSLLLIAAGIIGLVYQLGDLIFELAGVPYMPDKYQNTVIPSWSSGIQVDDTGANIGYNLVGHYNGGQSEGKSINRTYQGSDLTLTYGTNCDLPSTANGMPGNGCPSESRQMDHNFMYNYLNNQYAPNGSPDTIMRYLVVPQIDSCSNTKPLVCYTE